ncbi:kinase-like domain-containing protein [Rhodocollybia butyracea]|uniref:non-specific serine/threonine protein kinase n=1 Tax=Rhodocollybia butyracea TaxID=206335 RepID=A0A9P5Q2W3_9AGAR|nr:kinase-like domain-containing protein [Rhodocollybia butyracea]
MFIKVIESENVELYRPGGLHPVHLGDTFHNNRYTVVHKLGHGTFSTVWLVRDSITDRYAALKIIISESTKVVSEVAVFHHLQQPSNKDIDNEDKDYVVHLLDEFNHHGPNGTHQCIVTEVLGPSLDGLDDGQLMDFFGSIPTRLAKRIAAQISRGVRYLHKHRVVHGGKSTKFVVCESRLVILTLTFHRSLSKKHSSSYLYRRGRPKKM